MFISRALGIFLGQFFWIRMCVEIFTRKLEKCLNNGASNMLKSLHGPTHSPKHDPVVTELVWRTWNFFYELLVQMGRNNLCSGFSFPPGVIFPSPTCSIWIIHMLPKNYSLKILGFLGSWCCLGLQKYPYSGLQRKMNFQGHFQGKEVRQEPIFRSNLQFCCTNMQTKIIYLIKVSGI